MWKQINDVPDKDSSNLVKKMRYFISYPPSKSIRLIDVGENVLVGDILELAKKEFGLKLHDNGLSETSIALSYNGFDLKPKWSLADLGIPSGSTIRCIYKEHQAVDLYVHCGFNKQILKLVDPSIKIETTISTVRKKISDKLGLPLSTFCLETYDGKKRLYDEMKLINYDINIPDQIYLKVWKGYEKFISSCIRGYAEHYSHDDLTRYYQIQVALHIAAFYGHMELANSVMQQGARSDRPVGEHPSRQWSSESTTNTLPEMLKCPIHIAIERGHVKMVDLFVRHSILCTQIRDPITGYLPYKLALYRELSAKTKEEKQRYKEIYFYLHEKQYNLKIPLNVNGEYVTNLLTSTTMPNDIHHASTHHVNISLPFYCRIISWYERAREKAWKKFGGRFYTTTQTKRVYPKQGLLGYKVLIDGYNNTFEVPTEQLRGVRSGSTSKSDKAHHYAGYSDEEREKIIQMKTFMKQFALDERQRAKQIAAINLQQSRRPPLLLHQTSVDVHKQSMAITTAQVLEGISSSSEFSSSQIVSSTVASDMKVSKPILDTNNSSSINLLSTELNNPIRKEDTHKSKQKTKQTSKFFQTAPIITIINEEDKPTLPIIFSPTSSTSRTPSTLTNKVKIVADANKQAFQPIMSSADAYLISSSRIAYETEQVKKVKRKELFTQIEQIFQEQPPQSQPQPQPSEVSTTHSTNVHSTSFAADRNSILDIDSYIPLPDHPSYSLFNPVKSNVDLEIRQSTFQSYERHASASIRSTAINCLQEANYFKKKSWLKQVEISKEMVKHKVQRRIRRGDDNTMKKPILLPLRATNTATPYKTNTVKVN